MVFSVHHWAAWAPGLDGPDAWKAWLSRPHPLPAEGTPPLTEMPAMMRRRVDRLGRIALQAAYRCQGSAPPCPVVFASRYGDVGRSVDLLDQLARSTPLSPTSFSMSVHNAIGALYSIARGDTSAYSAVAAGAETVEAAFVEACGLLSEGAPEVMVVVYDEPLPPPFQHFPAPATVPHAWACRLRASDGASGYSLTCHASTGAPDTPAEDALPEEFAVLRFLVSGAERFEHHVGPRLWRWQHHA
ncbi:beta-ketoacyl synthase chain length factor [Myxococcus sp. RHSTA-1-4]|uniref:beta-ketoacyl synthase chain length factor n=1 Tax=Myxococcus sp. RHSTA-1-4 TaxID=2874601 RepID=UPI001CBCD311|nr:beta-ketoacyl synthase chain length factor [Myxococcus sp. RHSTA-1-4]MBZ4415734.1 beta-ketoacyl synthase chain length factor [Myxococcus sp. RHSTA-1-4]